MIIINDNDSISALFETWLMWPWCVKIHPTSSCLTGCCQFWQPCWSLNTTKGTLLMPDLNKALFPSNFLYVSVILTIFLSFKVGFFPPTPKVSPCSCWILLILLDLSKLLRGFLSKLSHRFVKINTWISVSLYKDLLVVTWICQSWVYVFLALC